MRRGGLIACAVLTANGVRFGKPSTPIRRIPCTEAADRVKQSIERNKSMLGKNILWMIGEVHLDCVINENRDQLGERVKANKSSSE